MCHDPGYMLWFFISTLVFLQFDRIYKLMICPVKWPIGFLREHLNLVFSSNYMEPCYKEVAPAVSQGTATKHTSWMNFSLEVGWLSLGFSKFSKIFILFSCIHCCCRCFLFYDLFYLALNVFCRNLSLVYFLLQCVVEFLVTTWILFLLSLFQKQNYIHFQWQVVIKSSRCIIGDTIFSVFLNTACLKSS